MTTLRESAQQVLEAVEADLKLFNIPTTARLLEAITTLRQALEAELVPDCHQLGQQDEPVAWMRYYGEHVILAGRKPARPNHGVRFLIPLYTRPQPTSDLNLADKSVQNRLAAQWGFVPKQQPLTDEQIKTAFLNVDLFEEGDELLGYEVDITRAIEAMHGIGGEA